MLKKFDAYNLAIRLYQLGQSLRLPTHLRSQFQRAASSVPLNFAEGSGRVTLADQRHFYSIALGSLREVQAILDLTNPQSETAVTADKLGACLWRLVHGPRK